MSKHDSELIGTSVTVYVIHKLFSNTPLKYSQFGRKGFFPSIFTNGHVFGQHARASNGCCAIVSL